MKMSHGIRFSALALGMTLSFLVAGCGGDGDVAGPETGRVEVGVTVDEAAESGVSVSLFEAGSTSPTATATTGANGTATFNGVVPGSYDAEVDPPAGLSLAQGEQARKSLTVTSNQTARVDFNLTEDGDGSDVVEITLTSSSTFSPAQVTISSGTTVRWVNGASIFHTITPDGHSEWNRATVSQQGETFEHTFENPGTFPYFCEPHQSAGMTGTITVQ